MGCSSDKNSKTIDNKKHFNTQNTITSQNISQVLTQNNKNAENEEDILIYNDLLVSENKEEIMKYYIPLETIGQGSYGKVFKVRHRVTGKTYAIKMVKKKDTKILNEIKILRKLDHPNIMKVYEYFSSEYCWYFVEEYVAGGDLYEQICNLQYYNEVTASTIMKQIFSFVSYLHQMNIVHRDIKPKNMMVSNKKDEIEIKLVDFGTATIFSRKKPLTNRVGTPIYMAPEVLKGNYFNECDLWSCGVILYILLGGNPPFDGKNPQEIYSKIEKSEVKLKGSEWNNVSEEAKDLIIKLLEKNVSKRITAQEALKHPFIINNAKKKKSII
jgi:calcium-dependent protein kinase